MNQITLIALLLIGLSGLGEAQVASTYCYTNCYTCGTNALYSYNTYENAWTFTPPNDSFCTATQTGFWIYYSNSEYNLNFAGNVVWCHGIDFTCSLPANIAGDVSSLKFAGNRFQLNEDSYTLYSGSLFTGNEFYGNINTGYISIAGGVTNSLIITGNSAWTFYTGNNYQGAAYCYQPTETDTNGLQSINYFIYPSFTESVNFYSVSKGCVAGATKVEAPALEYRERSTNGGWGFGKA